MQECMKQLPAIATDVLEKVLYNWFYNTAPGHFKQGAAVKYQYQERTPAYQKRKRKKGLPALVWSGRTRERLLRHGFYKVTKEKGKKTGIATGKFIAGPEIRYIYIQRRDTRKRKGTMNMAKELTTLAKDEIRAMAQLARKEVVARMNQTAGTTTVLR
jgi:hypothetical protein